MEQSGEIDIYFLLFAGTLAMFLLCSAIIVFFVVYQRRMLKEQLRVQEMKSAHQLDLLHSNIQTLENEHRRFASDLHDEIGGALSILRMQISLLMQNADDAEMIRKSGAESKTLIDNTINSVRRISHDLLPSGLETFGLVASLEDLCRSVGNASSIRVDFNAANPDLKLETNTELAIYRIVHELLNNTIKHAAATETKLHLTMQEDLKLNLVYEDNGKGMNLDNIPAGKGLGLKNIESRVSMVKGSVNCKSSPGAGMRVEIVIPASNKLN
jgi:signal transduction histidine kinase